MKQPLRTAVFDKAKIAMAPKLDFLHMHMVPKTVISTMDLAVHALKKGTAKSALKVPYTEKNKATDALLYALNSDKANKYFIPQYKIGVHRISGSNQFKISLTEAKEGEGGTLKIALEATLPKVLESTTGAKALSPKTSIALRFKEPVTKIDKRLPFSEITKTEKGLDIAMHIDSFNEFNQVYAAISDSNYLCRLELTRSLAVAVPKAIPTNNKKPQLVFTKKESAVVRGVKFNRIHLSIQNWSAFPNSLFKASPELPPCGANKKASRTWIQIYNDKGKRLYGYCAFSKNTNLSRFSFAVKAGKPIPKSCYVVLLDRKTKKKYISNKVNLTIAPQPLKKKEKLYTIVNNKFLQTEPFHFSESRHTYIYRAAGNKNPSIGGYKSFRLQWEKDGSEHTYLQDEINPKKFFFLPDNYALANNSAPLSTPKLNVKITGNALENLKATIAYEIEARTNIERLTDALEQLSALNGTPTKEAIQFDPLILTNETLDFKLALPESTGFTSRANGLLTLENIKDELPPISLNAFEHLFDILTNDSSVSDLLTGHVEVNLPGIQIAPIPVAMRLTEIDKNSLVIESLKSSNFQLEIKNFTSKIISAQGVKISIQDGENTFSGSKVNLKLPLKLNPGEITSFTVIPSAEILKQEEVIFNLTWEGMQQHEADGSVKNTLGTFSLVHQQMEVGNTMVVTNPLESSITIDGINGFLEAENKQVPLIIKNTSFPVTLAHNESFSFDAVAANNTLKNVEANSFFVWEGLKSQPNKERLFDAIVDTSINAEYESNTKVSLFIDRISLESNIRLLKVEFKNKEEGPLMETLIFDASDVPNEASGNVEKEAKLSMLIKDYILGSANSGQYWYRITLIKKTDGSHSQNTIGDWTARSGSLEITTELLPQ